MKIINLSKHKNTQAKLIDVLTRLMKKNNINIHQLSKNTGLANTTVKRLLTDPLCNPTLTSITSLSDFFGITPNQLLGTEPFDNENGGYHPHFEKWDKVPMLDVEQCIDWPNNIEEIKHSTHTKYVLTDIKIDESFFAMIVNDDTLEPKFSKGTILIFSPNAIPKHKDYLLLQYKEKRLPQFRQSLRDGSDLYVKNINPEFLESSPIKLIKGTFKILGVLIQAKVNYI